MKMIFDFGNVVMDAARRQTCLADSDVSRWIFKSRFVHRDGRCEI